MKNWFLVIARNVRKAKLHTYIGYAGFGLLVTLVWLYIEVLRLLSKLREK